MAPPFRAIQNGGVDLFGDAFQHERVELFKKTHDAGQRRFLEDVGFDEFAHDGKILPEQGNLGEFGMAPNAIIGGFAFVQDVKQMVASFHVDAARARHVAPVSHVDFVGTGIERIDGIGDGRALRRHADAGQLKLIVVGRTIAHDKTVGLAKISVFDASVFETDAVGRHFLIDHLDVQHTRKLELVGFHRRGVRCGHKNLAPFGVRANAGRDFDAERGRFVGAHQKGVLTVLDAHAVHDARMKKALLHVIVVSVVPVFFGEKILEKVDTLIARRFLFLGSVIHSFDL